MKKEKTLISNNIGLESIQSKGMTMKTQGSNRVVKTYRSKFAYLSTLLLLVAAAFTSRAQDVNFSQHYNSPTYYNPANVGLTQGLKVRLNSRRQWTGLSGEYSTYNFSADIAERSMPGAGGIGIIANQNIEGIGMLKTNVFGFIPSVRIPISRNMIFQLGALASVVTQQINWDNLVFQDQLDPRWGNIGPSTFAGAARNKVTFPDFSIGGLFQFQGNNVEGTFGGAAHHLAEPNQSFFDVDASLPMKFVYNMDFVINFAPDEDYYHKRKGFKLNPGVMVEHQRNLFLYSVGSNLYMSHIYLGLWYKNHTLRYDQFSSMIVMAGINILFTDAYRMKLMYSYEVNIYARQNITGPSHELSLILEFDDLGLVGKERDIFVSPKSKTYSPIECSPF